MLNKTKILIAEDESNGALYLKQTLIKLGYDVSDVAQTGEEVIKKVDEEQPQLILMDISLRGHIDGISAAENVHSRYGIPVIFLTAHTNDTMFQRAKSTYPSAYLLKPYDISQLRHAIEIALCRNDLVAVHKKTDSEVSQLNRELKKANSSLIKEMAGRKKIEKQLKHQAHHDSLTGLPNRLLLFELLRQALAFAERHNSLLALMLLDLDNFKTINDTMGHLGGDILLKEVAKRLQQCMRQYDTVCRIGGDEFIIVANDIHNIQDIIKFAEKVTEFFQQPFDVLGKPAHVTISMGVSIYPLHGSNAESLLEIANMAMYSAKNDGKNAFRFYSESINFKIRRQNATKAKRNTASMDEKALYKNIPLVNAALKKISCHIDNLR